MKYIDVFHEMTDALKTPIRDYCFGAQWPEKQMALLKASLLRECSMPPGPACMSSGPAW